MGLLTRATDWLEQKVAGSMTKRTLAADAAPVTRDGNSEPRILTQLNDAWSVILATHVKPPARVATTGAVTSNVAFACVAYDELALDGDFDTYLLALATLDKRTVAEWPKNARASLYINAYNALCANFICIRLRAKAGWPASVADLREGSAAVWDLKAGVVAGAALSLNEIEHGILRSEYDEPRFHAVLNCASKSCPDLASCSFRGDDRLDAQLSARLRDFLADRTKGLRVDGDAVTLSRIFLWYAEDFRKPDAAKYAAPSAPMDARPALQAAKHPRFFDYDWSLNAAPRKVKLTEDRPPPPPPAAAREAKSEAKSET